jgi:hypothetical protein
MNDYNYVRGDPVNFSDPMGLETKCVPGQDCPSGGTVVVTGTRNPQPTPADDCLPPDCIVVTAERPTITPPDVAIAPRPFPQPAPSEIAISDPRITPIVWGQPTGTCMATSFDDPAYYQGEEYASRDGGASFWEVYGNLIDGSDGIVDTGETGKDGYEFVHGTLNVGEAVESLVYIGFVLRSCRHA